MSEKIVCERNWYFFVIPNEFWHYFRKFKNVVGLFLFFSSTSSNFWWSTIFSGKLVIFLVRSTFRIFQNLGKVDEWYFNKILAEKVRVTDFQHRTRGFYSAKRFSISSSFLFSCTSPFKRLYRVLWCKKVYSTLLAPSDSSVSQNKKNPRESFPVRKSTESSKLHILEPLDLTLLLSRCRYAKRLIGFAYFFRFSPYKPADIYT